MNLKKKDKIFVAGHNGMAGSAIIRGLRKHGYENIITINRNQLDLEVQSKVNNFFKKNKITFVFLCAAKVGGIYANDNYPADFIAKNLSIQSNIIDAAFKNKIKKLIFLGSSCVYPRISNRKIKESDLLTNKLELTNEPYAVAKISGIKMCESYNRQYNTDYSHVMAALIRKFIIAKRKNQKSVVVWGTGRPKREFLYVDDFADAAVYLAKMSKKKYSSYINERLSHINIGYGRDYSIKTIANMIRKSTGFNGKIVYDKSKKDGVKKKLLDNKLIRSMGWKPKHKLEKILNNYILSIKNNINFK